MPTPSLPPMMALAVAQLKKALTEPPRLGDSWPFADPPAVTAARQRLQAEGRHTDVKPHQVVRLVRFVKLGHSKRQAALKAGLKWATACRILSGQHVMAHHTAVTAAGVYLPALKPGLGILGTVLPGPSVATNDGGVCALANALGVTK